MSCAAEYHYVGHWRLTARKQCRWLFGTMREVLPMQRSHHDHPTPSACQGSKGPRAI